MISQSDFYGGIGSIASDSGVEFGRLTGGIKSRCFKNLFRTLRDDASRIRAEQHDEQKKKTGASGSHVRKL
jgi:hypothetical protein